VYLYLGLLVLLVGSLGLLMVAMAIYRHQRMLAEKKAQYLAARKQSDSYRARFESSQAEITRLRTDYNNILAEMTLLQTEMKEKRKEIKEILDILKEETSHLDEEMNQEFVKIVERRKEILKANWKLLNGEKNAYLEKLKQAQKDKDSMNKVMKKKDEAFRKWTEANVQMKRIAEEYEVLKKSSLFSFRKQPKF